jgi:hypothetical protein
VLSSRITTTGATEGQTAMSGTTSRDDESQEQGQGASTTADGAPSQADQGDGGPGSHTQDGSGGAENDPASGGVPEAADES